MSQERRGREDVPGAAEPAVVHTMVSDLIATAITAHLENKTDLAAEAVATLLKYSGIPDWRTAVVRCAGESLSLGVRLAWILGWQPADLLRQVRRTHGDLHVRLVTDAVMADLQTYAAATVDPRWFAQLSEVNAQVWWPADQTFLSARLQQPGQEWEHVLSRAMDLLYLLASLTRVQRLGPLPGTATPPMAGTAGSAGQNGQAPLVDSRVLARIRALLAKAESTTSVPEAEALTAAAQERMARHNIDLAMIAATTPGPAAEPTGRRIGIDAPYELAKAQLLEAVASANRCRAVWDKTLGFSTVIGFEPDLDTVETLFTSVLVQAVSALTRTGSEGGPRARTRAFRTSFLTAYSVRIGERLTEIVRVQTAAASQEHAGADLLPVLASRDQAVDNVQQQMFPTLTRKSSGSISDLEGWYSGRGAADLATLQVGSPIDETTTP